jgi:hypothetical protein
MTLPTQLSDREYQKFSDVFDGSTPNVKVVGPTALATQATTSAVSTTLTTISGKLPTTLGQKTMAASLPAVLASDHSDIKLNMFGTTAAVPVRKTFNTTQQVGTLSGATDVMTIIGPSSGTVYITKIVITGHQQYAAAGPTISLIRRSSLDSGGSSANATLIPAYPGDTTTCVIKVYSSNPTGLGTAVGTAFTEKMLLPTTTTLGTRWVWEATKTNKPLSLTSSSTCIAANFNGFTASGSSNLQFCVSFFQI